MRYIDIHSHLNLPEFRDDRDEIIARLRAQEIATIVVGVDKETSQSAADLALRHDTVFACIGQHPTDNRDEVFNADVYRNLARGGNVVAIGECGLDYFRIKNNELGIKEKQKELFKQQIELAIECDLPLMLHCRPAKGTMDAYEDALLILNSYFLNHASRLRGNVHFFVGDISIADRFLALGFTMSFTGVITFALDYDAVIRHLPISAILSETDAPFAAPIPHRGKRSEPEHVMLVVARIAEIRQEDPESVRLALAQNAERLFDLKRR